MQRSRSFSPSRSTVVSPLIFEHDRTMLARLGRGVQCVDHRAGVGAERADRRRVRLRRGGVLLSDTHWVFRDQHSRASALIPGL
jgi:hypothetical protein